MFHDFFLFVDVTFPNCNSLNDKPRAKSALSGFNSELAILVLPDCLGPIRATALNLTHDFYAKFLRQLKIETIVQIDQLISQFL
jgi:hypothetical protein